MKTTFLIRPLAVILLPVSSLSLSCNERFAVEEDKGTISERRRDSTKFIADRPYDPGPTAPSISDPAEYVPLLDGKINALGEDERREKIVTWIVDCLVRNPATLAEAIRSAPHKGLIGHEELVLAAQRYHETYPGSSYALFLDEGIFDSTTQKSLVVGILTKIETLHVPSATYSQRNLALIYKLKAHELIGSDDELRKTLVSLEGGLMSGASPGSIMATADRFGEEDQDRFLSGLLRPLQGSRGTELVKALVGETPAQQPDGFEGKVLERWLKTVEPKVALDFLDPNAEFYRERRRNHFQEWLKKDSAGASDWMRRNMHLPDREDLGRELVEFIDRAGNPEDAEAWREALGIPRDPIE